MSEKLNLKKTALVLIDLQKGIARRSGLAPYSGDKVIAENEKLVEKLVNTEALIVFVHVKNYGGETLKPLIDGEALSNGSTPADFSEFVMPAAYEKGNKNVVHVTKHNWGAFFGTDLDVQLRRREIENIVLTGIATTIGVDTTAREAYQHGYNLICVEDAMTDFSADFHAATVERIFKRIARVRSTKETLEML